MRLIRVCALLLVAMALVCACDGKKDDAAAEKAGGEKAGAEASGPEAVALEDHTWIMGRYAIKGKRPKGWPENPMSDSNVVYSPEGYNGPVFWVATTCEGVCATLADNVKAAAAAQKEAFDGQYDAVELVSDEPVQGGHHFRIAMTKGGDELGLYVRYYLGDGWDSVVKCLFQANAPEDLAKLEQMAAVCDGFEVTHTPE